MRFIAGIIGFLLFGPIGILVAILWPSRRPILVRIEQPKPPAEPMLFRFFDWCAARGWMK